MKVNDFVNTAIKIANSPTVYYSVAGGAWCKWNGSAWNMDCVCMIKGIVWGFNFNKSAAHGGAVINESICPDVNANGLINICKNVSTNFNNIEYGEVVHMSGHVGIYIGNGQVVESTAWFGKTIISNIGKDGKRTKDGKNGGYWQNHGKLPCIDYSKPTPTKSIEELAQEVIAGKWGNNPERKQRLTNAGYDYAKVQARVNELLAPKVNYYPKFNNNSIVDGLKSIGVNSSFAYRTKIANKNGISNYTGTAAQNIKLCDLAKQGKLIKV